MKIAVTYDNGNIFQHLEEPSLSRYMKWKIIRSFPVK